MARVVLAHRARAQLDALSGSLRDAVDETIDSVAVEPTTGVQLLGRLAGTWRVAVGSYRILYTIEPGDTVVVHSILHRSVAYRNRSQRRRR